MAAKITVRAVQGDTLDLIALRHYGYTGAITEQLYAANPGLADHGPELPLGTQVKLPAAQPEPALQTINLWD